ncbi:MAG: glycosyltransferase [Lachnospiraceae bacterium]|nr:glycosyltransferase [Lachnospiraceae bacterium]
MKPTVSIIVPIYNAENSIRRCIDSILGQEYTDFELILVDDGSTDTCGTICDEYAARDSRIRVIHKPNTGVSDTRNTAIRQATGTYLQFLDSDDWITSDATKLLVRTAQEHNCDLVIADFYRVVGEKVSHKGSIEEEKVLTKEEFAEQMMKNPADFYFGVLWNKLYRRDLVTKYDLCMDTSVSWCEDFLFNLEYILHAEVFYALQTPIYYYVKTKGSLVNQGMSLSKTIKMKFMVFEYYNNFYKHVYDEKDYEKKRLSVYRFFLDAAGDGNALTTLLPSVSKLGNERGFAYAPAIMGEGILSDSYRNRKLLEHYLEPIAISNDLNTKEVSLLFLLSQSYTLFTRRELADLAGMTRNSLSHTLQRLVAKDYIKVTDLREHRKKYLNIELLPAAANLLPAFATVISDYDAARFSDFTEEELVEYTRLSKKMNENLKKSLMN